MSAYDSLAMIYDDFTSDVDYEAFANFYEKIFKEYKIAPQTILDLACGTGSMTYILAEKGYEMIGVDSSPEMLSVAREKGENEKVKIEPLFLNQSMEELDLYGTVDAAVCCLDGMNYVEPGKLRTVFERMHLFVRPGGIVIFDINTPERLRSLDGEMFIDETDDAYCVWRTEFDENLNSCFYGMDIFVRDNDDKWTRTFEEHVEYAHEVETLKRTIIDTGFEDVRVFGELTLSEPGENENRVFIAAVRK